MHIVWLILKIIVLYLLFRGIIITLYRYLFLKRKKRAFWLISMAGLGVLLIAGMASLNDAPTIVGWAVFLAIVAIISNDHRSKDEKLALNQIQDARFDLMGLKHGRRYFHWGLALFAAGTIIGWILFFAKTTN